MSRKYFEFTKKKHKEKELEQFFLKIIRLFFYIYLQLKIYINICF